MSKYIVLLLFLYSFAGADVSYKWLESPYFLKRSHYKDSHYYGFIEAKCRIFSNNTKDSEKIHQFFKKWADDRSSSKPWYTVKKYFKEGEQVLDAQCRSYTSHDQEPNGELKMLLQCFLASNNNKSQFFFFEEAENILAATGEHERLKDFKSYFIFTKSPKYWDVYIWRLYKIEGYWYEPSGMFIDGAKKGIMESFQNEIAKFVPIWAKNL